MKLILFTLLLLVLFVQEINSKAAGPALSRHKRYLAFPEGATLSIALCMTAQAILQPRELFTEAINWGISYDLPNATAIMADLKTSGGFVGRRRNRRDLYKKMELIMNSMGYDGKDCIFKALCETGALFNQRGKGVLEEILRIVFSFPTQTIHQHEPHDHHHYRDAHVFGLEADNSDDCIIKYSKCTISLIDMALGFYTQNTP